MSDPIFAHMSHTTAGADEMTTLELPAHVADGVTDRLPYTDFEDEAAYVTFVLEEVLASVDNGTETNYDAVDSEEVESRLESLGYMS